MVNIRDKNRLTQEKDFGDIPGTDIDFRAVINGVRFYIELKSWCGSKNPLKTFFTNYQKSVYEEEANIFFASKIQAYSAVAVHCTNTDSKIIVPDAVIHSYYDPAIKQWKEIEGMSVRDFIQHFCNVNFFNNN